MSINEQSRKCVLQSYWYKVLVILRIILRIDHAYGNRFHRNGWSIFKLVEHNHFFFFFFFKSADDKSSPPLAAGLSAAAVFLSFFFSLAFSGLTSCGAAGSGSSSDMGLEACSGSTSSAGVTTYITPSQLKWRNSEKQWACVPRESEVRWWYTHTVGSQPQCMCKGTSSLTAVWLELAMFLGRADGMTRSSTPIGPKTGGAAGSSISCKHTP